MADRSYTWEREGRGCGYKRAKRGLQGDGNAVMTGSVQTDGADGVAI